MDKDILREAALRHPACVLPPYDMLMGKSGFDAIYTLCETMGGTTIYMPSMRGMFAACLAQEAIREFDGYNYKGLARKFGFSERHVRQLVRGG